MKGSDGGGGGRPPSPRRGAGRQRGCVTERRVTRCPPTAVQRSTRTEAASVLLLIPAEKSWVQGWGTEQPPAWQPRFCTGPSCARGCRAEVAGTSRAEDPSVSAARGEWRVEGAPGRAMGWVLRLVSLPQPCLRVGAVPGGPLRRPLSDRYELKHALHVSKLPKGKHSVKGKYCQSCGSGPWTAPHQQGGPSPWKPRPWLGCDTAGGSFQKLPSRGCPGVTDATGASEHRQLQCRGPLRIMDGGAGGTWGVRTPAAWLRDCWNSAHETM